MDQALNAFLSWQFILFSLGIFVVTWVIRLVVEYLLPKAVNNKFWEELCLPLMPVGTGLTIAYFASKYPYPDGLTALSGRVIFGLVAGFLSATIYKVVKGMLGDKIQSYITNNQPQPQLQPTTIPQVIPFQDPNKGQ